MDASKATEFVTKEAHKAAEHVSFVGCTALEVVGRGGV